MTQKLLLICVIFCSCSTTRRTETDLYFGQSKPDGTMISQSQWNNFKEDKLAKVFKEGSTVINATGQWLDPSTHQLITEPAYIVTCFYKKSPKLSRQIDSLRFWYKTTFLQQSVLRVDKKVRANF